MHVSSLTEPQRPRPWTVGEGLYLRLPGGGGRQGRAPCLGQASVGPVRLSPAGVDPLGGKGHVTVTEHLAVAEREGQAAAVSAERARATTSVPELPRGPSDCAERGGPGQRSAQPARVLWGTQTPVGT